MKNWGMGTGGSSKGKDSDGQGRLFQVGKSCYESHPPLPLKFGGQEFSVYGGNCGRPIHLDCDVYVALQAGSYVSLPYPWDAGYGQIVQVQYSIQDGKAPSNVEAFGKMISWLVEQIKEGKKVHVGCIGGHGRTGVVLAAIVNKMMPEEEDPISYVRQNYCQSAVESSEQVQFLVKHYGAKTVKGTKQKAVVDWQPSGKSGSSGRTGSGGAWEFPSKKGKDVLRFKDARKTIAPVASLRNIFVSPA